jgi:hypothetical protein
VILDAASSVEQDFSQTAKRAGPAAGWLSLRPRHRRSAWVRWSRACPTAHQACHLSARTSSNVLSGLGGSTHLSGQKAILDRPPSTSVESTPSTVRILRCHSRVDGVGDTYGLSVATMRTPPPLYAWSRFGAPEYTDWFDESMRGRRRVPSGTGHSCRSTASAARMPSSCLAITRSIASRSSATDSLSTSSTRIPTARSSTRALSRGSVTRISWSMTAVVSGSSTNYRPAVTTPCAQTRAGSSSKSGGRLFGRTGEAHSGRRSAARHEIHACGYGANCRHKHRRRAAYQRPDRRVALGLPPITANNFRVRGSTSSTKDPVGARSYFGGPSEAFSCRGVVSIQLPPTLWAGRRAQ